jgi:K+/H+ antiporter YhaU regulatory subunit KhtT
MDFAKVKNDSNLIRDLESNAILNTNSRDYENYMRIKNRKERELKRMDSIESELNYVKNEISEIKNLLIELSNKK